MNPIDFEFDIETSGGFKINLKSSQFEKLGEIPNQPGVYILINEDIKWQRFLCCACSGNLSEDSSNEKLFKEFEEIKNTGFILANNKCSCQKKFKNSTPLILIGQSKNLQNRIAYFIASLIDNHSDVFNQVNPKLTKDAVKKGRCKCRNDTNRHNIRNCTQNDRLKDLEINSGLCRKYLHIEGARIRKLLEKCHYSDKSFKLKVSLIPTSNEDTAKQLEAILLNVYKLLHGCLPLFNKKIEGFKLYFL